MIHPEDPIYSAAMSIVTGEGEVVTYHSALPTSDPQEVFARARNWKSAGDEDDGVVVLVEEINNHAHQ